MNLSAVPHREKTHRRTTRSRWLRPAIGLGIASLLVGGTALAAAENGSSRPAAVTEDGGTVLPVRQPDRTGDLGVTFGMEDGTIAGGDVYRNNPNGTTYNLPMFKTTGDMSAFWDDYVEELVTAGVDFVAVDIRGYIPGSAEPNLGGDPRIVSGLVDAIHRRGAGDELKIAALDDTPASLVDKKNQIAHDKGGYVPPFDMSDTDGTGEGGYHYLWHNNQEPFFKAVPNDLLYKIDGRPVIYEWSIGSPLFSNQGDGNASRMLQYARRQAQSEFSFNPYYILDHNWSQADPSTIAEGDGTDSWFNLQNGGRTLDTYHPVADESNLMLDSGWSKAENRGLGDYGDGAAVTTTVGATATYSFFGTGFQYLSETNSDEGNVNVYIDGTFQQNVHLNTSSTLKSQQVVYRKTGLTDGYHTIKVVNKTTSVGMIDAFKIMSSRPTSEDGRKFGVAVPGFHSSNGSIDPDHGNTFTGNLEATVNAGATVTLVEGFTDWLENAATWRMAPGSYEDRLADYPNQMLNILRRYSHDPFPADMRVEAESADSYSDTASGNSGGVYRNGDIDVQRDDDAGGGWDVTDIAGGEWLQWEQQPMQGEVDLKVRVASATAGGKFRFVIDGQDGPLVDVPATGGAQSYRAVDAGSFDFKPGTSHTVRIEFPSGVFNLNYWTATATGTASSGAAAQPR